MRHITSKRTGTDLAIYSGQREAHKTAQMNLTKKIKLLVRMKNKSLQVLAKDVGVSRATISRWVNHGMTDEQLDRVCKALGVDREEVTE